MTDNFAMLYDHRKHTLGYYFMQKISLMNSDTLTTLRVNSMENAF